MEKKTRFIAGVGILGAMVVVLQTLATFIQFGPFAITLVLVPIVIGAAMYGVKAGAALGGLFGLVVLAMTISGADPGAFMLWSANPVATLVVIMLRGILAGASAGAVYRLFEKKNRLGAVVAAAMVSPMVNTGLFLLAMYFIFPSFLDMWAAGATTMYFLFIGLAGVNFIIEMVINMTLSPMIVRVIDATKIRK